MNTAKMRQLGLLAGAAALSLTFAVGSVFAAGMAKTEMKGSIVQLTKFEDLDKNKDGAIAKDEVPLNMDLVNSFASFDANSDNQLSKDEFATYKSENKQVASKKAKPRERH